MTTMTPTRLASMPRVNLLPPEIAAAERLRQLKLLLGLLVVGALVLVGMVWFFVSQQVGGAQDDLAQAQAEGAALDQQIASYAEVPEVYGQVDVAQANLVTAMTPEIRFSFYLNDLSLTIPKSSRLTSLVFANTASAIQMDPNTQVQYTPSGQPVAGTMTYVGRSTSFDAVATWLQSLGKSVGVTDPTVTNVTEAEDASTVGKFFDVESNAYLTPEASSGRYAQVENGE
jgi:Tfp pilus assembly protein PilN